MSQQPEEVQPKPKAKTASQQSPPPQVRIPEVVPIIGSGSTVMYPQQLMPVLATDERDIRAIDDAANSEIKVLGI